MKSRVLSVVLLLSVFILNTPKSWWHECEHKLEASSSKEKTFAEKSVECDFCDHVLSAFTVHSYDFFNIQKSFLSIPKDKFLENVIVPTFEQKTLRGPPSLII